MRVRFSLYRHACVRLPDAHLNFQSPGHEQVLAPMVFYLNRHAHASGVFHLNRYSPDRALAPMIFHLDGHALAQGIASRIFRLKRYAPEQVLAPRVFHLYHQTIEQALAPDCLFNKLRSF